jgi:hypothetical protein
VAVGVDDAPGVTANEPTPNRAGTRVNLLDEAGLSGVRNRSGLFLEILSLSPRPIATHATSRNRPGEFHGEAWA